MHLHSLVRSDVSATDLSWRRHTVRGDGVDLAVQETGDPDAPPVVLVHGYPDTHRLWLPLAERLAAHLRVVAYDTRGQGLSPTDTPDDEFTLPHLAADLMAVVHDARPDRSVHVVGHGGRPPAQPVTSRSVTARSGGQPPRPRRVTA